MKGRVGVFIAFSVFLLLCAVAYAQPRVVVVDLEGRIDEGAYYTVKRGLEEADKGVVVVVIRSYGGYLKSMDKIVELLVSSEARTIAWVPPGERTVSAAAVIALSAQRLYMGKGAVIGSIKPYPDDPKTVEYVVARVAALLSKKGVNDSRGLARRLVVDAQSFTSDEAVATGIADGTADSLAELLQKEGLSFASVHYVSGDLVSDLLSVLLDPALAVLLALLGAMLLLLEFKVTGFQGWGVIGAALIVISLYSFDVIGVSLSTFILALLGITLIIVELAKPGVQVAGIAGVALIALAVILEYASRPYPVFTPNVLVVAVPLAILVLLLAVVISKALETVRMKAPSLQERLIGKIGVAKTRIEPGKRGVVYVDGEDWTATSEYVVEEGESVEVVALDGLFLKVKPVRREHSQ
ncbi:protein of unknown function DUF107 [Thermofilum pendens Hrk 5]|uniref:Uncharacterized protein n=2 Tax=Thermofilum pendens TaxID=2269 RepID=A1RYF1_THEPD|nr:protein of unknown function DUF107 [Thermofilum pendens Hrk 5]